MTRHELVEALRSIVGATQVLTDADTAESYSDDWSGRYEGHTPAVVRPGSTDEVARIVRLCAAEQVALVPQGGNTGLVGGGVPLDGEIVLSLRRLDALDPIDLTAQQVTAQAGVTIAEVKAAARQHGLDYGVDLASRDSATVGGTIGTNAGGIHVLRWGGTRAQVVGIEAVMGDGSVISHLGGLVKDNTGYDLAGLLCGSEGTLGVVTAARLRLVPHHEETVVALVAFDTVDDAVQAVGTWRRTIEGLDAAELFLRSGLELVEQVAGLAPPFARSWTVYVLLQVSGHRDPTDALAAAVEGQSTVRDVAVASDHGPRRALWAYREEHTLAISTMGPPHKLDVTLPAAALAQFIADVPAAVAAVAPEARTWLFGHVADGNVHVNVTGVEPDDDEVDGAVLRLVAAQGGSVSAEHGIGRAKRPWLALSRSPAEIETFRRIKAALDPQGILNPNVLLP